MAGFSIIPGLMRQQQSPVTDPANPIQGVGTGIAPVAPPVSQVAPPTAPSLPPVNTMAPQRIGLGGRLMSGALEMFAPQVAQYVPGTTQHQSAMEAQGLTLRPPQGATRGAQRIGRIIGAVRGERD